MHRLVEPLDVDEAVLLLVAKHFQRWLAEHGEVKCRSVVRGVGKHELVCQCGLSATRSPGNDVEREFGHTSPRISSSPGTPEGNLWIFTFVS